MLTKVNVDAWRTEDGAVHLSEDAALTHEWGEEVKHLLEKQFGAMSGIVERAPSITKFLIANRAAISRMMAATPKDT